MNIIPIEADSIYQIGANYCNNLPIKGNIIIEAIQELESNNQWIVVGAIFWGMMIGWNVAYINRYQDKEKVSISDLTSLIGALGGAVVLTLFSSDSILFGAYATGLFGGFSSYFLVLIIFSSKAFGKNMYKEILENGSFSSEDHTDN